MQASVEPDNTLDLAFVAHAPRGILPDGIRPQQCQGRASLSVAIAASRIDTDGRLNQADPRKWGLWIFFN